MWEVLPCHGTSLNIHTIMHYPIVCLPAVGLLAIPICMVHVTAMCVCYYGTLTTIQWRHNGRDSVSNHQPHDCLLNRLCRRRSEKTSKLHVTGLCAGNSSGTGEFPAQMASYAEMFPFDDVIMMGKRCTPLEYADIKHERDDIGTVKF